VKCGDGNQPGAASPKAMAARSRGHAAKYAKLGLALPAHRPDHPGHAAPQLYLAHYEGQRFARALRGCRAAHPASGSHRPWPPGRSPRLSGLGEIGQAIGHLRLAARSGPASRRAFHFWTLGSLLYLEHRYTEAASALSRAVRWGTTDKRCTSGTSRSRAARTVIRSRGSIR